MTRNLSKLLLASACALVFAAPAIASSFKVVHSFKGGTKDGSGPEQSLTPDGQGGFFGVTSNGGNQACYRGCGTVFHIAADGTESVIYRFAGPDGSGPFGAVVLSADGSLYGSTTGGGAYGCGTIYRLSPGGTQTLIYSFAGEDDGSEPTGIVLDKKGNVYGTTIFGGHYSVGTAFKITPKGKEEELHVFAENPSDGGEPSHNLVFDKAGNLYGDTSWGGSGGYGTIFRIAKSGDYSVLYNFSGDDDGGQPESDLTIDRSATFMGPLSAEGITD